MRAISSSFQEQKILVGQVWGSWHTCPKRRGRIRNWRHYSKLYTSWQRTWQGRSYIAPFNSTVNEFWSPYTKCYYVQHKKKVGLHNNNPLVNKRNNVQSFPASFSVHNMLPKLPCYKLVQVNNTRPEVIWGLRHSKMEMTVWLVPVCFTSVERIPRYTADKRLDGSQNRSRCCEKSKKKTLR